MTRALAALVFAVAVTAVPLTTVSACSCEMTELPEAIETADLAIVATSVAAQPMGKGQVGDRLVTTWAVERSRDPLDAAVQVQIESFADSGANCGISFGTDERWLVLAYAGEGGVLETNGCMQNRRLDGSDPEAEALITEMLLEEPSGGSGELGVEVPTPILVIGASILAIGAVSALAFRRPSVS